MRGGSDQAVTRRTFLRTATGATAAAATAGLAAGQDDETTTEGSDGNETDGTETEGTPEGTETEGGDGGGETVEVVVGPGGDFTFEPGTDEPLQIAPGTTVLFVWDSNTHNIVVDSQPDDAEWEGHEPIEDEGFEYEFTFEVEGTYEYYCEPHRSQGMEATIEVTQDGGGDGGGGGGTEEVIVGPDGDFVFEPGTDEPLQIQPGTTVNFVWESDTHNIVVEDQPDDAEWEGHEAIEDTGFEYEYTFEVEGTYEYFCEPHRSAGMVGTIEVSEDAGGGGDGGGEAAAGPQIPDAAKTLGVITVSAMASVLALAYVFLKYGGDYGEVEA